MRNPFRTYIVKDTGSSVIEAITKEEFQTDPKLSAVIAKGALEIKIFD